MFKILQDMKIVSFSPISFVFLFLLFIYFFILFFLSLFLTSEGQLAAIASQ